MSRISLVTGASGQMGHYVAELLSARGDTVYGLLRRGSRPEPTGPLPYEPIPGDLLDSDALQAAIERVRPDEIYNFAAHSFVPASWREPIVASQNTALGVVRLLEVMRRVVPGCRLLQAGSSELFANAGVSPQDERTPIVPRNPYGAAKAFAYHTVRAYREHYGLHASNAIFYTMESPRRATDFLFRKVTDGVAAIVAGERDHLPLGNLDTVRDWGYAPDFARAAVLILAHPVPDDFVIATGVGRTARELCDVVFGLVGKKASDHVRYAPELDRPSEPAPLVGDSRRARELLGWRPTVSFEDLARLLLAEDLRRRGLPVPF